MNEDSLILSGEKIKDIYLKGDTICIISNGEIEIYNKSIPVKIIEEK